MPKAAPFEAYHRRYDEWFVRHVAAYQSELLAVRALLPWRGRGLDIGVGTGRFAFPLGVQVGIDPSRSMLTYAVKKGVSCLQGVAEALPFKNEVFDYGLMVTTICFVEDAGLALSEAYRVLKPGADLVMGFIDKHSQLGQHYLAHKSENVFYRDATFFSAMEVKKLLSEAGFKNQTWGQTLSKTPDEWHEIEPLRAGSGEGSFLVVKASKAAGSSFITF